MDNNIFEFLDNHGVCAFTTLLPDGSPHAAALQFSYSKSPFQLYALTKKTSRKAQGLSLGQTVQGSVVVGLSGEEWITLQMDGEVTAVTVDTQIRQLQEFHFKKHPHMGKRKEDPAYIFLKFTPTWWRYTDFNTEPITIISSD